jgi:hypothetical protein
MIERRMAGFKSCACHLQSKPLHRLCRSRPGLSREDSREVSRAHRRFVRARFIVHLSDFTTDHSAAQGQVDDVLLEHCVTKPEDVSWFFPRGEDMFGINVHSSASIQKFLAVSQVLRAIRRFNLTHMNRGRNAYQASHSYSVADHMLQVSGSGMGAEISGS